MHAAPVAWLLLIDAMLIGVGLAAFLRQYTFRASVRRLAQRDQPRLLDSSSKLIDVGRCIVVSRDTEYELVGVADNRYARA